jgi:hypothetical protein
LGWCSRVYHPRFILAHPASFAFAFATFFRVAPRLVLLRLLAMRFVFATYFEGREVTDVFSKTRARCECDRRGSDTCDGRVLHFVGEVSAPPKDISRESDGAAASCQGPSPTLALQHYMSAPRPCAYPTETSPLKLFKTWAQFIQALIRTVSRDLIP